MRISVAITAGVLLLTGAAGAQHQPDEAAAALRDYYSANGLLNRGLYDLAVSEYRAFLDRHPGHEKAATARYGLAVSLVRLGRNQEALAEARPLAELPQFEYRAEALMVLGQCQLSLDRYDDAAESFGRVVRDEPGHDMADEAAALQAEAWYEAARFAEVDAACRVLAERWPDSPHRGRAEFFRGLSLAARGDDAAAAAAFEPLAQSAEGDLAGRATLLLARSLQRSNQPQRAEQAYRRVIERRPDLGPEAAYGLAVLLHAGARGDESAALLDGLLADHPQDPEAPAARLLRGRLDLEAGRYPEALDRFAQIAGQGELADDAAYWSARCALEQGRHLDAAAALAQALEKFPQSELAPAMTVDRAAALLRGGDANAAAAAALLADFERRFPGHELAPEALDLEAAAERQRGRFRESLALCERFRAQYPDHARAANVELLAAGNRFTLRDYEGAAAAYRAIIDSANQDAAHSQAARLGLGLTLHQQQLYREAETWLRPLVNGPETAAGNRAALLALGDGRFQLEDWAAAQDDLADYLASGLDQPAGDEALLKLGLARQRLARGEAALESFDLLVERFPVSPHRAAAELGRGEVLLDLDRDDEAEAALRQAAAGAPGAAVAAAAQQRLGELMLARGDGLAAADLFRGAASAWGDRAQRDEALLRQASALMAAQRFREAIEVLSELVARAAPRGRPAEAAALRAIAMGRSASGDAVAAAMQAIESIEAAHAAVLEPQTRASLAYERAWCLRALGRSEDAAAAYREVLGGPATGLVAQHAAVELAEIEAAAGRNQEAARILRSVLEGGPAADVRGQAEYRLGACELALGDHEGAAARLERYLAGDPDTALLPSALLLCAEAQGRGGFYRRAIEHLERLTRDFTSDETCAAALLKLGEYRAALREWAASEAAYEAYRGRSPDSDLWFQAAFGAGRAKQGQERYEEAIACYRQVTARHDGPTAARAQFQIGECLFAMGRRDEAAKEFLKVDILYAFPEWSAAALYEAGRCFEDSGSPVEARKQFELVTKQHPQSSWARLAEDRLQALARNPLPGRADPPASASEPEEQ